MKKLMITLLGAAVCCAQLSFADDVVHVTPDNPVTLTADNIDEYAGKRFEFAGGTFDLNGQSISIVSISGTDASSLITNSAEETVTLTLTEAASDTSFAGAIAPSVTLAKTGASQTSLDVTDVGSAFVTAGTLLFPGLVDSSGWTAGSRLFCASGESPSLVFGNTCKLDSTTRPLSLALTNATLYSKKDITFGNKTTLAMLGGTWRSDYASTTWMRSGTATVENVTAEMRGSLAFDGTSSGSSSVVLKNVCGNFTNFVIGAKNGQTSNVIIEGGAITNYGCFVMGFVASENNLTIRGGKHRFRGKKFVSSKDPYYTSYPIHFNFYGTSSILFEGDDTVVDFDASSGGLSMGAHGETTTFTVNGGKVTITGSGYFCTDRGTQNLYINGGSLSITGDMTSSKGNQSIEQTGGTVEFKKVTPNNFDLHLTGGTMIVSSMALNGSKTVKVKLEGGTLKASTGGICATYNAGAKTSFYANGGTLVTRYNLYWDNSDPKKNSDLLNGFVTGELGEKGLTVDTKGDSGGSCQAPIRQHLTLAEGATRAVLVKKSGGELRLLQDTERLEPVWDFAGGVEVQGGTLTATLGTISESVAAGGAEVKVLKGATFTCYDTLTNAVISGGGTVNANGGLESPVLSVPVAADGTVDANNQPVVKSAATGKIVVDFGRTADNPLPLNQMGTVKVATWSGSLPDTSTWEVKGTGYAQVRSKFAVSAKGDITVSVRERKGMILIVF